MIKNINVLRKISLFRELSEDEIFLIMQSKACFFKRYSRGTTIYGYTLPSACAGIILKGTADILHPSVHGHEAIVNRIMQGDSFGLAFACMQKKNPLNDIRCVTEVQIMFLEIWTLLQEGYLPADMHERLLKNVLITMAQNNIELNVKIQILGQKTLQEKLMAYFEQLAWQNASREIFLPFNREELACFLCSERSSVSRELSRLSDEGRIKIKGNQVELLSN